MADPGHNGRLSRLAGPVLRCSRGSGAVLDRRVDIARRWWQRKGTANCFGREQPVLCGSMVTEPGSYIYSVAGITAANWATGPALAPGAPRPCFLADVRLGASFASRFRGTAMNGSVALGGQQRQITGNTGGRASRCIEPAE